MDSWDHDDGDQYMIKITADDGEMQGYKTCDEPFAIFNNNKPNLEITYPTSGEKLSGTVMIEWEAIDAANEDKSEELIADVYYKIGLSTYEMLLTGQPNEGMYEWNTTSNIDFKDGIYGIKVVITDSHGAVVEKEVEGLEVYNPDAPELNINNPANDETIKGKYAIRWDCDDPDGDDVLLSFYYSSDKASWEPISENKPNDNNGLVWDTNNIADGLYHLKITATDGELTTETIVENIMILNYVNFAPTLEIITPRVIDAEISGTFEILWNAVDDNENDVLKISIGHSQNQAIYETIAEDLENTGSYLWDTLTMEDGEYTLEITVSDGVGEEVSEISYRFFIKNDEDPDDDEGPINPGDTKEEGGSSSSMLIISIIVAIIVLLAVLALVIFLFIKNSKSDDGVIDPLKQPLPIGPNSSQLTLQGVEQGALPSMQDDRTLPPPGPGMPPA
jgi:flagellar basal body-associated protein FliL